MNYSFGGYGQPEHSPVGQDMSDDEFMENFNKQFGGDNATEGDEQPQGYDDHANDGDDHKQHDDTLVEGDNDDADMVLTEGSDDGEHHSPQDGDERKPTKKHKTKNTAGQQTFTLKQLNDIVGVAVKLHELEGKPENIRNAVYTLYGVHAATKLSKASITIAESGEDTALYTGLIQSMLEKVLSDEPMTFEFGCALTQSFADMNDGEKTALFKFLGELDSDEERQRWRKTMDGFDTVNLFITLVRENPDSVLEAVTAVESLR